MATDDFDLLPEISEGSMSSPPNKQRTKNELYATALNNLGVAYGDCGDNHKSREMHERALSLVPKSLQFVFAF